MFESERRFVEVLKSQKKKYIPQPYTFRFGGNSYRPDFYCPDDDIYYEVKTGSLNGLAKNKIINFKKSFPEIKLKIVSPDGLPYYAPTAQNFLRQLIKLTNLLSSKDILALSDDEISFINSLRPRLFGFSFHAIRR